MVIFLLLGMPASVASAQVAGRCYPPPCVVEAGGAHDDLSEPSPVVGAQVIAEEQSAAPFVLTGLLAVMGSLTVVGLRRRSHILGRGLATPALTRARPAPGPVVSPPVRSEQAVLRSSVH